MKHVTVRSHRVIIYMDAITSYQLEQVKWDIYTFFPRRCPIFFLKQK